MTGKVIRAWADLELSLSSWLIELLPVDELRSRMIWDSFGDFRGKMGLLKTLVRNFADEDLWSPATAIFDAVEKLAAQRYILPHAFGRVDEAGSKLTFRSERAGEDCIVNFVDEASVDATLLKQWLDEIEQARSRAREFEADLRGKVHDRSLMHRSRALP